MKTLITQYLHNLKTLEVFITGIQQTIIENTLETLNKNMEELNPLFLALREESERIKEEKKIQNEEIIGNKKDDNAPLIDIEIEKVNKNDVQISFNDRVLGRKVKSAVEELTVSANQLPLLFESSLISLVTFFELLISSLLHEYVKKYPDSLSISKKELKYSDLVNFDSIEDAKDYLIEKELQNLMYDGLKSWIDFFKNKIKIDMSELNNKFDKINEILIRRNLFVHNGGNINSIYLSKVSEDLTKGMNKGDRIEVNLAYMLTSLNLLKLQGIILGIKVWSKRKDEHIAIVEYLHELSYECMTEKKWDVVGVVSDFIMDFKLSEVDVLVSQMNKWLSIKRTKGLETIKDDIEKLDLSAKEKRYRICRYALLNDHENVFKELKEGFPEKLQEEDIKEWPIFEDFRASKHYQQLIEKQGSKSEVELEMA
ncbi:hypothetical protein [Paenibacillus endoradicis]|uniref:hypothetical protein n=1 Tax=Paenibacillus endoradicis TaxID=2972487 RepID=UPI002159214B|nr:hypothetical protein [Paenibacillus endoradicis]MCR8656951.1 hypothetical protein [Paenibacillus endoradicis]